MREIVERGREEEPASRASVVVDGHARDPEHPSALDLAILVEIHHPVRESRGAAALAQRLVGADRLQSRTHPSPPGFTSSRGMSDRPIAGAGSSTTCGRSGTMSRTQIAEIRGSRVCVFGRDRAFLHLPRRAFRGNLRATCRITSYLRRMRWPRSTRLRAAFTGSERPVGGRSSVERNQGGGGWSRGWHGSSSIAAAAAGGCMSASGRGSRRRPRRRPRGAAGPATARSTPRVARERGTVGLVAAAGTRSGLGVKPRTTSPLAASSPMREPGSGENAMVTDSRAFLSRMRGRSRPGRCGHRP